MIVLDKMCFILVSRERIMLLEHQNKKLKEESAGHESEEVRQIDR